MCTHLGLEQLLLRTGFITISFHTYLDGCAYSTKYRMVRYEFDNTLEVSTNFRTSQSGF